MRKRPDEAELFVFRTFVSKLITLQKERDDNYQGEGFLLDKLLTAVYFPETQSSVRDRMTRKTRRAIHRIANRLRDKPKTAVSMASSMVFHCSRGRIWLRGKFFFTE